MAEHSPTGTLVDSNSFPEPPKYATRDMGGAGMYSSTSDYMRMLMALLRNDGKLISRGSVAELLNRHVKDNAYLADENNVHMFGDMWPIGAKVKCNHSLGIGHR